MSAIPKATARRIDHLARGAHAFHRFAHHPLCGAYQGEVLRVGRRIRICRGCLATGSGALLGLGLGGWLGGTRSVSLAAVGCAAMALAWIATRRRARASPAHRAPKLLTRALPMVLGGFALAGGLRLHDAFGLGCAGLSASAIAGAFAVYRRLGPRRSPCATCPERGQVPCSGTREIWRRERAFARAARRLIDAR